MIEQIAEALAESWQNFATAFAHFVPRLVAALIILLLGWAIATLARLVAVRVLAWIQFDRLALRSGAEEMLRGAELPGAERLIAEMVFWVCWIGFIVSAVDALQLQYLQGMVDGVFWFVPRLVVALLVLAVGLLIGNFVWRATLLASVNAGLPGARLLSSALRLIVIAIAVVMAFEQVGLASRVVLSAFTIAFGAVMLGLALAFGLGGREIARRLLEEHLSERHHRDVDIEPHL